MKTVATILIAITLLAIGHMLGEQSATTQCLQTMRTAR